MFKKFESKTMSMLTAMKCKQSIELVTRALYHFYNYIIFSYVENSIISKIRLFCGKYNNNKKPQNKNNTKQKLYQRHGILMRNLYN